MRKTQTIQYIILILVFTASVSFPNSEMENSFVESLAKVNPCVVGIIAEKAQIISISSTQNINSDNNSLSKRIQAQMGQTIEKVLATGVVLTTDGVILTSDAIISTASSNNIINSIQVRFDDGRLYHALPLAHDPYTQIALLKINAQDLTRVTLGDSDGMEMGSWILSISRPYGYPNSAACGIISGKNRQIFQFKGEPLFQTSLPGYPGSIGSPIIDLEGKMVGMIIASVKQDMWPEITLAIPSNRLASLVYRLLQEGKIDRGYLGIHIDDITQAAIKQYNLPADIQGVLIKRCVEGSPAEKGGIMPGDCLTHFDGIPLRSFLDLIYQTAQSNPGEVVTLNLLRNGKPIEIKVELGALPKRK